MSGKSGKRTPAANRLKNHLRRAVIRSTDITPQWEAALRRRTRKCPICDVRMTDAPTLPNSKELDHMIPLNVGGTHTIGNVRIICRLCNLKRPKDGSDYAGPVTLWAQVPQVMMPAPKIKPAPKPTPESKPRIMVTCGCGVQFEQNNRNCQHCGDCLVRIGQQAAALRAEGLPWKEVAERVGYRNIGNLHGYAVRYGGMPRRAA